jgi:murein DD-endopeptidase MepM/ murein hydrolase activator NlpD
MRKKYTVMIVPDRSSSVRRLRVAESTILGAVSVLAVIFIIFLVGSVRYYYVSDQLNENNVLRQQNTELKKQLVQVNEKVAGVQNLLDRVQRFDTKLRAITQLHDPKRHLALGPFDIRSSESGLEEIGAVDPLVKAIGENPQRSIALLGQHLDDITKQAEKLEGNLRQLETFMVGQKTRLSSTPSIWPARGWLTSGFGVRMDPYTGKPTMHSGIDVANQPGAQVLATANGVIAFCGNSGGFGLEVVIDHGFGLRTRYGHLSDAQVRLGDHVERGEAVGKIGNSGRSTGPHLHYEVEVNGLNEDPKNYILED